MFDGPHLSFRANASESHKAVQLQEGEETLWEKGKLGTLGSLTASQFIALLEGHRKGVMTASPINQEDVNSVFGGKLPWWQRLEGDEDEKWDKIPWKNSKHATAYINELVGRTPVDIECEDKHIVWHLDLSRVPSFSAMTSSKETDLSLFVSKGTKDCYDEVAETLEHPAKDEPTRFIIIGNPGIGKTWSIIYLLRCILVAHCEKHTKAKTLKHNTLVAVVEDQESNEVCGVVWCGDTGGGIRGWRVCKCGYRSFYVSMCGGLKHKETVYIVNSGNIGRREPGAHHGTNRLRVFPETHVGSYKSSLVHMSVDWVPAS